MSNGLHPSTCRWTRSAAKLFTLSITALLMAPLGGVELEGQRMPRPATPAEWTDTLPYRVPVFFPQSGAPGTRVRVETAGLPAITPVVITMAGTRSGFEVIAQVLTDRTGRIVETVEIPEWAAFDRSHAFVVMDFYFRPIAYSELFIVTNPRGEVRREGEVVEASPGCLVIQAEDGDYTLVGQTEGIRPGTERVVEGALAAPDSCRAGPAIRVAQGQPRPPSD
jgi:hypothetical protein